MAIEERYSCEYSDKEFDNVMEAVHEALSISKEMVDDIVRKRPDNYKALVASPTSSITLNSDLASLDNSVSIYRHVKYSRDNDFAKYTMNKVTFPKNESNIEIS